jgi:hypothetical protein
MGFKRAFFHVRLSPGSTWSCRKESKTQAGAGDAYPLLLVVVTRNKLSSPYGRFDIIIIIGIIIIIIVIVIVITHHKGITSQCSATNFCIKSEATLFDKA